MRSTSARNARGSTRERDKAAGEARKIAQKLDNADFVRRAPEEVVEENRERLAAAQRRHRAAGCGAAADRVARQCVHAPLAEMGRGPSRRLASLLAAIVAASQHWHCIGIAIGAVGIGGVLLVPFLTLTLGIDVKRAIAAALLSYLPSCVVAVMALRAGAARSRGARRGCSASLHCLPPGSGARAAQHAPAALLEAAIGVLLLARRHLRAAAARDGDRRSARLAPATLLGLGGGTGFVSALTGAGGAFVLLPVLLLLDMPVLAAIGLGQAIALPIAGLASLANIAAGIMDLWLAAGLAATLTLGIAIGTPIAHALPQLLLRRLLGSAVVLAGLAMLARTAARL